MPVTEVYSNLAFDWINRKIYYLMQGASNDDKILYMMDIDGSKKTRLAPAHRAQTLTVDPRGKTSKVFYATMGGLHEQSGQIVTCDLSGSGHNVILGQHIFNVRANIFCQNSRPVDSAGFGSYRSVIPIKKIA